MILDKMRFQKSVQYKCFYNTFVFTFSYAYIIQGIIWNLIVRYSILGSCSPHAKFVNIQYCEKRVVYSLTVVRENKKMTSVFCSFQQFSARVGILPKKFQPKFIDILYLLQIQSWSLSLSKVKRPTKISVQMRPAIVLTPWKYFLASLLA